MGVDISVWRSRIGMFNACVRRSSGKRAKQSVWGAGCSGLEVVVVTAVLLVVVMAGELQSRIHQEHLAVLRSQKMIDTPWPLPTGSAVTEREQNIKSVHNMLRQHCDQTGQYTTLHPVAVSIRETLGLHMTTSEPVHQHWSSPVSTPTTHHSHISTSLATISPPLTTPVSTSAATTTVHHSPAHTTAPTTESSMFVLTTPSPQDTTQGCIGVLDVSVILMLLLLMSGDVELNPGPGKLKTHERRETPPSTDPAAVTDREQTTTSVCDVFRAHYSKLVRGITQPNLLAADLFSLGLISESTRNKVTTITSVDNTDRAIIIMDELEARFRVDPRPVELMGQLCEVIGQYTTLHPVAVSIRETLGLHMTTSGPVHQHWSSPVSTPTTHRSHPQLPTTVSTSAAVAGGSIYHSPAHTTFSQTGDLYSPHLPPGLRQPRLSPIQRVLNYLCCCYCTIPPVQEYVDYLKSRYRVNKFPTYFKEPSLHIKPKEFIHLNLLGTKDINEEDCGTSFLSLHVYGNIKEMKKKRKVLEMVNIGKSEDGSLSHSILVEGAPGIGKSTLSWELCRQWAQGEMLQDWDVVVLLQLRIKRVREAITLSDLLFHPDTRTKEQALDYITSTNGRRVMIIFDGYDELSEEQKTEDSIFHQLLVGQYLSECTIMVTSRPITNSRLYTEFKNRVDQHIEIVGFSEEDIDSYTESVCRNMPNILSDLKSYLSSNPFVYSAAYVPLQCAIVTALYIENWKKKGKSFAPSTLTELYTALVEALLLRHVDDHPEYKGLELSIRKLSESQLSTHPLWKLAQLAAEGLEKRQYIFDNVECDTMGMTQSAEDTLVSRQHTPVSHCFLHLTLQEYLAALYWSRLGSEEVVSVVARSGLFPLDTLVKEGAQEESGYHWPALFFLAGLTKLRSVPIEHLKSAIKSPNVFQEDDYSALLYGKLLCDSRKCHPSFFQTLFEAQSHELTTAVFAGEIAVVGIDFPLDAFVTAWCLTHSDLTSSWFISMELEHSWSVEYLEKQLKGLDCFSQHHHGRIVGLFVDNAEFLSSLPKLHPCTQQLEVLVLNCSNSLQASADEFATHLTTLYPHLKYLIIVEPQWVLPVLSRLHELTSLTSVTLSGGSADFAFPPQHCPSLRTIGLKFSTHVSFLSSLVLHNVNTLKVLLLRCPLTSDDITVVCSGLRQTTSLRILGVTNTTLSPSGAKTLVDAIKQNKSLEKVAVRDGTIGDEGVRVLEEVLNNHSTVTEFDVEPSDDED